MKTKKLALALTIAVVVTGFSAFGQENRKASEARKDVVKAEADSTSDFQSFKKDAELKITQNKQKIADLKTKKADDNKETKERYDKKVLALEQKNDELKKRIEGCSNKDKSMWESFKTKFNNDMEALMNSIKSI